MTWNYRIVKRTERGEDFFAIHEAFYTDNRPTNITTEPIALHGESLEDLAKNLEQQQAAFRQPVLNYEDF